MIDEVPLISFDSESPDRTPLFAGTTVPVASLMDHLATGGSLNGFLEDFPAVSRKQAETVIVMARQAVEKALRHPEWLEDDAPESS